MNKAPILTVNYQIPRDNTKVPQTTIANWLGSNYSDPASVVKQFTGAQPSAHLQKLYKEMRISLESI